MAAADFFDAGGEASVREGAACGAAAGGPLGGPGSRPAAGGAASPRALAHGARTGSPAEISRRTHAERCVKILSRGSHLRKGCHGCW